MLDQGFRLPGILALDCDTLVAISDVASSLCLLSLLPELFGTLHPALFPPLPLSRSSSRPFFLSFPSLSSPTFLPFLPFVLLFFLPSSSPASLSPPLSALPTVLPFLWSNPIHHLLFAAFYSQRFGFPSFLLLLWLPVPSKGAQTGLCDSPHTPSWDSLASIPSEPRALMKGSRTRKRREKPQPLFYVFITMNRNKKPLWNAPPFPYCPEICRCPVAGLLFASSELVSPQRIAV